MIDITPSAADEERAVKYLVTEKDGTTHLPYTDASGKPDHRLMGAAWAATHGGYRGKKYAGPDKDKAIEKLAAVYKSEGMDTPEEKKSAPADETRMGFICPQCGYEGDTDDEACLENSAPKFDERRANLTRLGRQFRALPQDLVRSLSQETQDGLKLVRQCSAACYGVMTYLSYLPYDYESPEGLYGTIYECYMACDVCTSLAGRESPLSSEAHDLCAAACREVVTSSSGVKDVMLQALANVAMATASACDAMGGGTEGRAARNDKDEVRSCKFEIRSSEDGHIKGYPILFNELSQDLGGFRERILPDAITLDADLKADFNHSPDCILGRSIAGTLAAKSDEKGVYMDATPPDTSWARDLKVSMDRGDIDQGSFSFRIQPGGQTISVDENGQQIRTLTKILVRRLSIVSDPAYSKTHLESRSLIPDTTAAAPLTVNTVALANLRRKLDLASL